MNKKNFTKLFLQAYKQVLETEKELDTYNMLKRVITDLV